MKVKQLKKLAIANAVSAALIYSVNVQAEEQLVDAKFTLHNQQLLVNSIYLDGGKTSAEVDLLTAVEMLPAECDVVSVYPTVELYIDNPPVELADSWTANDIEFAEQDDADEEEEEEADETEEPEREDEDELESESGDEDDDEDDDDDEEDDNDELDEQSSEQELQFLTVSFDGYLVFSKLITEAGITTCNSTYIGELDGDTYTPPTPE